MWNSKKSAKLSLVCNRLVMILMVACVATLPTLMERYAEFYPLQDGSSQTLMLILYVCCAPAAGALICLDRLLVNIRREEVFIAGNVRLLRILSWCCFAVALVVACGARYYLLFALMAIIAAFIGLILRVVKNVIEQAVKIKAENDYTI